jgi:hypothetical protein
MGPIKREFLKRQDDGHVQIVDSYNKNLGYPQGAAKHKFWPLNKPFNYLPPLSDKGRRKALHINPHMTP